jgi:hypothetical protein
MIEEPSDRLFAPVNEREEAVRPLLCFHKRAVGRLIPSDRFFAFVNERSDGSQHINNLLKTHSA